VLQWIVVGMMLLAGAESAHGQRLIWLGTLGGFWSEAHGVSADGSVVVGWAHNASYQNRAFRWTASGGMQDLGTLGGGGSIATGVSADGSVVVGYAEIPKDQWRAFRWTAQTGMQDLGTLGGNESWATGVSADGSVVVGYSRNASGDFRAFRWTAQTGMQDLGTLGGDWSEASGVSADGSVVVGEAANDSSQERAFRWTAEGGMQDVGTLPGYEAGSEALGVSADGSVVVGRARNASYQQRAFRWTAAGGMQDLNELYAALLQDGSVLEAATAMSPDGRYIVGWGQNAATGRREAFLLDTQGTSSVEDGSEDEFTITISPQPVGDHGWVHVRLGRLQYARVEVRDILGRLMTVLGEGVLGEQRWHLPQLAAGVYTVMVRTGHGVAARQFVVTR
jgi:probable HAF family extracellular repeat protein